MKKIVKTRNGLTFKIDGKEYLVIGETKAFPKEDKICTCCFQRGHFYHECKSYIKRNGKNHEKKLQASAENNEK